jgi:hypothetical protein
VVGNRGWLLWLAWLVELMVVGSPSQQLLPLLIRKASCWGRFLFGRSGPQVLKLGVDPNSAPFSPDGIALGAIQSGRNSSRRHSLCHPATVRKQDGAENSLNNKDALLAAALVCM